MSSVVAACQQNRFASLIRGRRAVIFQLIVAALLLPLGVQAQAPSQSEDRGDEKTAPPLELKLSTTTPALYAGSCLVLELEVTNTGKQEVRINKRDLWMQFTYGYYAADGSGNGGGQSSSCEQCPSEYILLSPGISYRSGHCFDLTDEFFRAAGEYGIATSIHYDIAGQSGDSVDSNRVHFNIY